MIFEFIHLDSSLFLAGLLFSLHNSKHNLRCGRAFGNPAVKVVFRGDTREGSPQDASISSPPQYTSLRSLIAKCPALGDYAPSPLFALDVHGQATTMMHATLRTIGAILLRRVAYHREEVVLEDDGTIALDWVVRIRGVELSLPHDARVVMVQHGICGSSESEYLIHTVEKLSTRGYRVVVMVARGCGGLRLSTYLPFSASRTTDMAQALDLVASRYPASKILALGFSLGAGITLRYLGSVGDQTPLSGAVCVSPYWDLHIPTPVMPFWGGVVGSAVKLYALIHREHFKDVLFGIIASWSIKSIDSYLAPMHGHASVHDYYSSANPITSSAHITVPTLAVNASDDPLCSVDGCPVTQTATGDMIPSVHMGPGLVCAIASTGGHLGFPEGWLPIGGSWTDRVCLQWFDSICDST